MSTPIDRRSFLKASAAGGAGLMAAGDAAAGHKKEMKEEMRWQKGASPFPLALNASTIRPADTATKLKVAAETGWDAIEFWTQDLESWEKEHGPGSLKDLNKRVKDAGLYIPNVIGLWNSMPATEEAWQAELPKLRELMRICSEAGSERVAVLPFPDREEKEFDLQFAALKYKELIHIGKNDYNIKPMFEFIGFLKGMHRLGQACAVAIDADEPEACVLPDTFHLYRGGSGFAGIKHLSADFIGNFHWNDVPAEPAQKELGDKDRIYPGDGILPLTQALKDLKAIGYNKALSLELFNRVLWEQDPMQVGRDGLRKMLDNIAAAGV
jgi:2-keto-myo-inositol isomerase